MTVHLRQHIRPELRSRYAAIRYYQLLSKDVANIDMVVLMGRASGGFASPASEGTEF